MTPRTRVWVKVCGITRPEDVEQAVDAGADAVGFVLTARSRRAVAPEQASRLAEAARREAALRHRAVVTVGVFAGEEPRAAIRAARAAAVDVVQLHSGTQGEAPWRAIETAGLAWIGVVWPDPEVAPAPACLPGRAWALLMDRRDGTRLGGTGLAIGLDLAAAWAAALRAVCPRVILAGGLRPDTVQSALDAVRPWGVDVSSGVEMHGQSGVKDARAVRAFVDAVRGWEQGEGSCGC